MKIGIYGGTFNPPHLGHMCSAKAAVAGLELDKLIFIPAALPPHKEVPHGSADEAQRLEMTTLMAQGLAHELGRPGDVSAADLELRRGGKSYTADTLAELRALYPEDELWLLMGSDMFLTFQTWHEPERIVAMAGIATFAREEGDDLSALYAQAKVLKRDFGAQTALINLPKIYEESSTRLRAELAKGGGGDHLWVQVYGYILRHQLYGAVRSLKNLSDEELRAASYSMVRAGRIRHIRGTEETAEALALRWGADPAKARRAAILHDCTKYLSDEEQLALCERYGEVPDQVERENPKLLHAKTGAWIAREEFGADNEIFGAIYWHTTGRAGMTLLEKIIYLADYMEPGRSFPGVEHLRTLAEKSLDKAVLLGFEMSIREMEERGLPLHSRTVEARDWQIRQGSR